MASLIKINLFHFLAEPSTSSTRETLLDIKMRYSGTIATVLLALAATSVVAAPQPNPDAAAPTPVIRSEVTKTLDKRTVYSGVSCPMIQLFKTVGIWWTITNRNDSIVCQQRMRATISTWTELAEESALAEQTTR